MTDRYINWLLITYIAVATLATVALGGYIVSAALWPDATPYEVECFSGGNHVYNLKAAVIVSRGSGFLELEVPPHGQKIKVSGDCIASEMR